MADSSKVTSLLIIVFFASRHYKRYPFTPGLKPMKRAFFARGSNFDSIT